MASPRQEFFTPVERAREYPFPNTERSQSFSRLPRRQSTASSVFSSSSQPAKNALVESGPNAISTLVSPPIIRTGLSPHNAVSVSGFKVPTQRDIPPVALTNIPHVEPKAFNTYLTQVGSLYEAFQRAKNEIETGETSLFHRDKKGKTDDWEVILSKRLQRPAHSRSNSNISNLSTPEESPKARRRSIGQRKQAVTPLSTIPAVYSEEDFHLENPRTFDVVSERSEIVTDPKVASAGQRTLATNAILQEKLSWYMDTVEIHLINSISTASKSFFSALGSLRELHDEAEDSVNRIQKLRKDLSKLDKEMAVDGLKVVNLKQRRDNIRRLAEAIFQLEDVVHAVKQSENMVNRGEIDGVLDQIDSVETVISGNEVNDDYTPIDLTQIKALSDTFDHLNMLRTQVGKGYERRFHDTLISDLRKHVAETGYSATLKRWGQTFTRLKPGQARPKSGAAYYVNVSSEFRLELEDELKGLARANFTTPSVTTFRALVLKEMKSMIRKQLPSANDDDAVSTISASTISSSRTKNAQEKSTILARNIRAMDTDDWYQMLVKVYTSISESLRRLSVQVKLLLDITSAMEAPLSANSARSPPLGFGSLDTMLSPLAAQRKTSSMTVEVQQALDLSNLLGEAVDAAQNQITRVLRVRSQQNKDMTISEFVRFFALNKLFADECEAISGRSGTSLKTVVDSQIREYVSHFGNSQIQALVEAMDSDKWEARDFGLEEVARLGRIIDASTSDIPSWTSSACIWEASGDDNADADGQAVAENGSIETQTNGAVIDEQKFILTDSALAMLRTLEQYEIFTTGIPGVGQEIANSLLECLKTFNSRSYQLILGAGATRSAGLKSITTKHLTLSSQTLSFAIALVPYVREFFRRHVPASSAMQSLTEFDKIKRLFQEHQTNIHEKFVDIMSGRSLQHIRVMKAIDWDEAAQNRDMNVSPYMETLCRDTMTLQRVLARHLSESNVMSIMGPVFVTYKNQWSNAFREVDLKSSAAKERLLSDAQHFASRIGKLDGANDIGSYIVNIVSSKPIESDPGDKAIEVAGKVDSSKMNIDAPGSREAPAPSKGHSGQEVQASRTE